MGVAVTGFDTGFICTGATGLGGVAVCGLGGAPAAVRGITVFAGAVVVGASVVITVWRDARVLYRPFIIVCTSWKRLALSTASAFISAFSTAGAIATPISDGRFIASLPIITLIDSGGRVPVIA